VSGTLRSFGEGCISCREYKSTQLKMIGTFVLSFYTIFVEQNSKSHRAGMYDRGHWLGGSSNRTLGLVRLVTSDHRSTVAL